MHKDINIYIHIKTPSWDILLDLLMQVIVKLSYPHLHEETSLGYPS